MIRILLFFALIAGATFGLGELLEKPGSLTLDWFGYRIETSPLVGLAFVLLCAIVLGLIWSVIRFVFHIPTLMSLAARARKHARGHDALTRGILAAGAGDAFKAQKAAVEARKYLPNNALTLLLEAQTAQLAGDRAGAEAAFRAMVARGDTKLLGLRGLHAESLRQGDADSAHQLALEAQNITPLNWSGQAVLDRHASQRDWESARLCIDQNLRAKIVDPAVANRQKAVLDTAIAMGCELTDPERAIKLLRSAVKKAPDLIPATALLARMLSHKGDLRGASKLIEAAYTKQPHPDLASAYLDVRPGDSSADRLARARTLAKCAPSDPESAMIIATAALGARDFATARQVMTPLVAAPERPTARMCLIMAELEEREHGARGLVREWLSRGSRAPRDAAWTADGSWSKQWAPISPVTGKLDAYRWLQPKEELSGPAEEAPAPIEPAPGETPPVLTLEAAPVEPPAAAEPAKPAAAAKPARQPVVFPLAAAPDDPGPKKAQTDSRLY